MQRERRCFEADDGRRSYDSIGQRSARHEVCVDSVLCFDMPLSAQFIGDISLIPKRAG
jgi:hypothetical protein